MTPEQLKLARHALGLDYKKVSYRNRYYTIGRGQEHKEWLAMVEKGYAIEDSVLPDSTRFELTRKGAEAALLPGETLCPEDFPPTDQGALL